jgi:hypothetical protein
MEIFGGSMVFTVMRNFSWDASRGSILVWLSPLEYWLLDHVHVSYGKPGFPLQFLCEG